MSDTVYGEPCRPPLKVAVLAACAVCESAILPSQTSNNEGEESVRIDMPTRIVLLRAAELRTQQRRHAAASFRRRQTLPRVTPRQREID